MKEISSLEEIQNSKTKGTRSSRLHLLFVLIFLMLGGLVFRLSFLQLTKGNSFRESATESRFDQTSIPAPRGFIYDRNKNLLVTDTPSFTLMYSGSLSSTSDTFKTLVENVHKVIPKISKAEITKRMTENTWISVSHRVYSGLTDQQVTYIREHQEDFPGFDIVVEPERKYLSGDLAGNVIGYMNSIPADEAQHFKDLGYQQYDKVGISGVEKQYESYLKGKDGKLTVQVDSNNHLIKNYGLDPAPVKGDDLVLSIDSGMQAAAQKALEQSILDLQKKGKPAKEGAVVVMNPNTGEVYALASYPYFNPQWFVDGIDNHLQEFIKTKWGFDNTIQGQYPPGSTEKPLTAMAALEDGVIDPWRSVYDPGYFMLDGQQFNNWVLWGHGQVNLTRALAVSNDTYFYNVAFWYAKESDGPKMHKYVFDRLNYYQNAFGLTSPNGTGIDLPNENRGELMDGGNPGDLLFAAIGQDEYFTPIGLAQYTSAIANGGKRMEPHVVKQIIDANGHVVKDVKPKVLNTVPVSAQNIKIVQQGMEQVVSSPEGTAHSIFLGAKYTVAGKTGTAEVGTTPNNNDTSVFIGYAPVDHPQIAISIVVPAGGHSSDSIGPISRQIFDYYFSHPIK
jgi:penicillin-binding protein 2